MIYQVCKDIKKCCWHPQLEYIETCNANCDKFNERLKIYYEKCKDVKIRKRIEQYFSTGR
jgi:hypothetical protein